ncbi:MAG TPA: aminotransferase class IV [Rickettsiales bacterium]|nr:aminotransferase class IV [Rickettsiales bacterium]
MPIAYFKDGFQDESACHVGLRDRSFRFGDGLFETMLVAEGKIFDLPAHIERLKHGLESLHIALDLNELPAICVETLRRNELQGGYLRVVVSRGEDREGASGYLPDGCTPYLIVLVIPRPYPSFAPLKLWQSSYYACAQVPAKTNNGILYSLALLEARAQACDNALLLDGQGRICETASGSIFWVKDETLYTPAPDLPLVPGTMRHRVMTLWPGRVEEGHFLLDALRDCDEVFMTNSGVVLAPIVAIEPLGVRFDVGKQTKYLRKRLDEEIQRK